MKAILVIDYPKSCAKCDCQLDFICVPKDIDLENENIIPDWCPLRPLPNKQETVRDEPYSVEDYRIGYNDCLAEITGETE